MRRQTSRCNFLSILPSDLHMHPTNISTFRHTSLHSLYVLLLNSLLLKYWNFPLQIKICTSNLNFHNCNLNFYAKPRNHGKNVKENKKKNKKQHENLKFIVCNCWYSHSQISIFFNLRHVMLTFFIVCIRYYKLITITEPIYHVSQWFGKEFGK